jgi:hypothetical protein
MWAFTVVVGHPLRQDSPQMPLVERNHPIETLAPSGSNDRSQYPLACGVRTGVFSTRSDIASSASSTAGAKMSSRSCTRKRYGPSIGRPFRNCCRETKLQPELRRDPLLAPCPIGGRHVGDELLQLGRDPGTPRGRDCTRQNRRVAAHVKPRKSGPASRASAMAISASVSALASASGPARPPVCDRTPRQWR